ncbi:MAG: ferredoxin [Candidatus Magasanikbacteria bacterium]|nr:ferredoxin [Candidatus Magasanikbacteria bacterium]
MKINIDQEKCIGCGTCVAIAPNTFRMNDETNKAEVINPPGDSEEIIKMGVESCPTAAIVIE